MLSVSLRHAFPGFTLDAAFDAPPGVTALFGASGSGKTTIINAVAGLLRTDAGRVQIDDRLLADSTQRLFVPPHRRRIGYVFQDERLFPHLTVRQNLLYGRWFGKGNRAPVSRIVDLLGIGHLLTRRPAALSGGERQRVALGRAILSDPQILLMDEPLAALDQARKDEILPYLERLRDEVGLPILYVSHAVTEVARLATTVVLIEAGRVTAAGPVADIMAAPATAAILGGREVGAVLTARITAQQPDGLTLLTTPAGALLLPGIDVPDGAHLRLHILAQDVMIALMPPQDISALNVIAATIRDLTPTDSGVLVRLDAGGQMILSRITARSAATLALRPGLPVHAVLKAVSVAPETIGISGG